MSLRVTTVTVAGASAISSSTREALLTLSISLPSSYSSDDWVLEVATDAPDATSIMAAASDNWV
jgi:hypothetical protein